MTAGAALEAAEVGIYELAITVPRSLPPMVACSGPVRSNYILNVITSQGAEPVPVCIRPVIGQWFAQHLGLAVSHQKPAKSTCPKTRRKRLEVKQFGRIR